MIRRIRFSSHQLVLELLYADGYANAVPSWSAIVGLQQTTQSLDADDVTRKRSDAGVAAGQKIATGEKNLSL